MRFQPVHLHVSIVGATDALSSPQILKLVTNWLSLYNRFSLVSKYRREIHLENDYDISR